MKTAKIRSHPKMRLTRAEGEEAYLRSGPELEYLAALDADGLSAVLPIHPLRCSSRRLYHRMRRAYVLVPPTPAPPAPPAIDCGLTRRSEIRFAGVEFAGVAAPRSQCSDDHACLPVLIAPSAPSLLLVGHRCALLRTVTTVDNHSSSSCSSLTGAPILPASSSTLSHLLCCWFSGREESPSRPRSCGVGVLLCVKIVGGGDVTLIMSSSVAHPCSFDDEGGPSPAALSRSSRSAPASVTDR